MQGALLKTLNNVGRTALVMQKRTIVETPPTVRMNVYKKIVIGGAACCTYLIVPAYVLLNLKYYNKSAVRPE